MTTMYFTLLAATFGAAKSSSSSSLFIYIILFGVVGYFYFRFVSKSRSKMVQQRSNTANLVVGDEVLTSAGIFGIVEEILDDRVVISTGDQSTVTILKSSITSRIASSEHSGTFDEAGSELATGGSAVAGDDVHPGNHGDGDSDDESQNGDHVEGTKRHEHDDED